MYVKIPGLSIVWKFAIFVVAAIGILMEFGIIGGAISTTAVAAKAVNTAATTINFLPIIYFTMIVDIMAMVYFLMGAIWMLRNPRLAGQGDGPNLGFKHAVTVGIIVAAIIADSALASTYGGFIATVSARPFLQVLLPIMVLVDWLVFEKKGQINSASPIGWLGLPALYAVGLFVVVQVGTLIVPTMANPYSFLNANVLTLPQLFGNIFVVAIIFLIVGYAMFAADHAMARVAEKNEPTPPTGQYGDPMVDENDGQPMQGGYAGHSDMQGHQGTPRMRPR